MMKTASAAQIEAYKAGQAVRAESKALGMGRARAYEHYSYDQFSVPYRAEHLEDSSLAVFFDAGFAGAKMPAWVTGWRLGSVPACGFSYNFRDNVREYGVSMMAVDGSDATPDGTFEMFNKGRARVRVAGWLVTHKTGSDGEPMLVDAVEIGG
jgi:hypothetical protein